MRPKNVEKAQGVEKMTKYNGRIEAKEQKVAKNRQEYSCFTIAGKKWNCFDAIVNKEFIPGYEVEFETEQRGEYENLIPETMKKINAPVVISNPPITGEATQPELKTGWKNET